jgi:hypothetical protein
MAAPAAACFEVTRKDGPAVQKCFSFLVDPEGHVVGLSKEAVQ